MPRIQNKSIRVKRTIHAQLVEISKKLNITIAEFAEQAILEKILKINLLAVIRPKAKDPPVEPKQNCRFDPK
jgi:hypothetical protein